MTIEIEEEKKPVLQTIQKPIVKKVEPK